MYLSFEENDLFLSRAQKKKKNDFNESSTVQPASGDHMYMSDMLGMFMYSTYSQVDYKWDISILYQDVDNMK